MRRPESKCETLKFTSIAWIIELLGNRPEIRRLLSYVPTNIYTQYPEHI